MLSLDQPIEELEALAASCEAQKKRAQLAVVGIDHLLKEWSTGPWGQSVISLYWSLEPSIIRGVLGRVRTALTEFVAELRAEVGDSDQLPSAQQTDNAFRAAVSSAVITNSNVTIVTATTERGDIMPDRARITINDNETTIKGSSGNISVASAHVVQVGADGVDGEKIRQFADLISQIAPTLGLSADSQAELHAGADDLQAVASAQVPEKGRLRQVLHQVLKVLRVAGPSAARQLAVTMGDDLIRELGGEIVRELPH
jgi:hypothetical protein